MKTNTIIIHSIVIFLGLMGNSINACARGCSHGPAAHAAGAVAAGIGAARTAMRALEIKEHACKITTPSTAIIPPRAQMPFLLSGVLCVGGKNIPIHIDHTSEPLTAPNPVPVPAKNSIMSWKVQLFFLFAPMIVSPLAEELSPILRPRIRQLLLKIFPPQKNNASATLISADTTPTPEASHVHGPGCKH